MKSSVNYYSRKIHRYLGVFIGIQFFFWTIGGFYFSWTTIEEIRGEHLRNEKESIAFSKNLVSPSNIIPQIAKRKNVSKLQKIELIEVLKRPFYEITVLDNAAKPRVFLADAITGEIQKTISQDVAKKIAISALKNRSQVTDIELLSESNVGNHHEYREKPLPVYAVTFEKPSNLTVYVSANTGKVESFRTNSWRVFDFLWMLHTMDYQGRDDFNNYVLRAFSILGMITIASGFLLFFLTSPVFRNQRPR